MNKSKFLLLFSSLFLSACHSSLDADRVAPLNSEPFTFKFTPGKAKTPSSIMPTGFGPIRGPSINSSNEENSITKDLGRCGNNLLNQQLHFEFNF
ncbi:hypothetical protein [Rickettsiella endosymbiont of Litargus connexus]|jgi:hypothetical protein|uniref:hypothetical protein n=1 Tax=Rickettsiella endosymbiont of Litargus connexus TaxID=3066237 RepID=UPI0027F23E01|nr:hypothetical protein [Gammaproteobacteria bacterium]MCH9754472.1 hypothetical protein [Gammaproteobacteria bacterium]MDD4892503.1 hypothetical protein [Candidatus Rickettsiella isopodorum]MDD5161351.1 hypothetical protein [Candidatus Rickettsiella isopodorum]MDQ5899908.1 hypothetical protein [Pseudomonadota bacterium]